MSLSEQQRVLNFKLADLRMEFRKLLHSSFKPLFKYKELETITVHLRFSDDGSDVYVTSDSPLINQLTMEQIYDLKDNRLWKLASEAAKIAKQFDTEYWLNTFDVDVTITFREEGVYVYSLRK